MDIAIYFEDLKSFPERRRDYYDTVHEKRLLIEINLALASLWLQLYTPRNSFESTHSSK